MYNEDIVEEDAILSWDDEKNEADESDKVFVKQAQKFIQVGIIIYFLHTYYKNYDMLPAFSQLSYVNHFSDLVCSG